MDELKQGETRTSILIDTQTDYQSFSNVQTQQNNEKREEAKKKLFNFVENEQEKKALPKQSISLDKQVFENEELKMQTLPEKQTEEAFEPELQTEQEVAGDIQQSIENNTEEEVDESSVKENRKRIVYAERKKTNIKLRLKLAACAIACVLTCLGGWAIYNAVEIKTLTGEAQAKNAQYSINVVKVISNTSKLDDLTNPNSITNLDELESANIVQIIPKEKSAPQTIEKKSNWFDRVCNWLSNLFK
ncbi:MAG: hypothetical protein MR024_00795 [Firmicutes bacterium]|nr:hypothetical protein [Bacillota bacterium]